MNVITCILVVASVTMVLGQYNVPMSARSGGEKLHFAYKLKSLRQSLDECAQYLNQPKDAVGRLIASNYITQDKDLKCLIRCAGVNSGWWNETTGVQGPVIESYFQPSADDTCYARRTKECISSKLALCQDDCSKAYETFLCYYQQWGNLKCSPEYIPLPRLDAVQAAFNCFSYLRTPKQLLEQYSKGVFPEVSETKCLYRCQYIAEGLYEPALGMNLTRVYIRNHAVPDPEILSDKTKACVEYALRESCDECSRVFRATSCVEQLGVKGRTADLLREAATFVVGKQQPDEQNPPPRYSSPLGMPPPYNQPQSNYIPPPPPPAPEPQGGRCRYNCRN